MLKRKRQMRNSELQSKDSLPSSEDFPGQATFLSFYDRGLMDFAKKMISSDLEVLRSFANLMITLITSLFPIYFAVLQFMDASSKKSPFIVISSVWISILLLFSLLIFVTTLLPSKGKFTPMDLNSIESFRQTIILRKRKYTFLGLLAFSITLLSMVVQFLVILYS